MFARLNRHGLLEEIERRQSVLSTLPGEQNLLAQRLIALTQQLSSLSINKEQRNKLKVQQEELEIQLYRLLPKLKPRSVKIKQVAAALPLNGVLVEFQRYRSFDSRSKQWGATKF